MENLYKINLPNILDALIDPETRINDLRELMRFKKILNIKAKDYFTNDILKLKNLNWADGNSVVFKKAASEEGFIHTDGFNISAWGINWAVGAPGGMCYWDQESCLAQSVTYDSEKRAKRVIETTNLPSQTYRMEPRQAYLINGNIPHCGFNDSKSGTRYAFSIRQTNHTMPWESVVELFSDLIIN